jgi:hypothetical protein
MKDKPLSLSVTEDQMIKQKTDFKIIYLYLYICRNYTFIYIETKMQQIKLTLKHWE